jgi:hypothetical protein
MTFFFSMKEKRDFCTTKYFLLVHPNFLRVCQTNAEQLSSTTVNGKQSQCVNHSMEPLQ